jgi:signal transduction histidine kinase
MSQAAEQEPLFETERFAALGRMLANVAHDFSGPVAALTSNTELEMRLVDTLLQPSSEARRGELLAALQSLVRVDQEACGRLRELVKALKTAARAGGEKEPVDVNDLTASMIRLAASEFRDRVVFRTDFGDLPRIDAEPSLLAQAIMNLLSNAGQASPAGGAVTVGTRLDAGQIHIWVADSGCGIRNEDQPKVLRHSFTTKPVGRGTGLGLMIVSDVVRRVHGGTVDFESVSGEGTTFHLRIPLHSESEGA